MLKILLLLTTFLLCIAPAFAGNDEPKMPLQKKIIAEKILLTEKFGNALQKCRERTRKRAREMCVDQKKTEYANVVGELEQNPRAYFAAQERNEKTAEDLREINSRRPRQ